HGRKQPGAVDVQSNDEKIADGIFFDAPLAAKAAAHDFSQIAAPDLGHLLEFAARVCGGRLVVEARQQSLHFFEAALAVIEVYFELARQMHCLLSEALHHGRDFLSGHRAIVASRWRALFPACSACGRSRAATTVRLAAQLKLCPDT